MSIGGGKTSGTFYLNTFSLLFFTEWFGEKEEFLTMKRSKHGGGKESFERALVAGPSSENSEKRRTAG